MFITVSYYLILQLSEYSQTCVKQSHKGSAKSGCLRQVAA